MRNRTRLRSVLGLLEPGRTGTPNGSPVAELEQRLRDATAELDREARTHPARRSHDELLRWWAEVGDTLDAFETLEAHAADLIGGRGGKDGR